MGGVENSETRVKRDAETLHTLVQTGDSDNITRHVEGINNQLTPKERQQIFNQYKQLSKVGGDVSTFVNQVTIGPDGSLQFQPSPITSPELKKAQHKLEEDLTETGPYKGRYEGWRTFDEDRRDLSGVKQDAKRVNELEKQLVAKKDQPGDKPLDADSKIKLVDGIIDQMHKDDKKPTSDKYPFTPAPYDETANKIAEALNKGMSLSELQELLNKKIPKAERPRYDKPVEVNTYEKDGNPMFRMTIKHDFGGYTLEGQQDIKTGKYSVRDGLERLRG